MTRTVADTIDRRIRETVVLVPIGQRTGLSEVGWRKRIEEGSVMN